MKKKYLLIIIFNLLFFTKLFSGTHSIKGILTDHNNEPLPFANIYIKEIKKGVVSDGNGNFKIDEIPHGFYTLIISSSGFIKQETKIELNKDINLKKIKMKKDVFNLSEVVISTTRNQILRKDAPIMANLLDKEMLSATQSVSLIEGLAFQPALRTENNCQNCGSSGIQMNGLKSAYTQILIDGRPIFSSLQGVYGLEQIPANIIEKVEIVKSGGSALYGSSSIAGTVNVITKEPDSSSLYFNNNLSWLGGKNPDHTFMFGGSLVSEDQKKSITINASKRARRPWDANGDGFSEIGIIDANNIQAKLHINPTSLSKLTINGYFINELRRGGNKFSLPYPETDITEATTHNIYNGGITYEQYSKNKLHKISGYLNYQHMNKESYYGSHRDPNAYGDAKESNLIGGIQYSKIFGTLTPGKHTLISGVEYNSDKVNDNAPAYDRFISQKINQLGFYAQDMWEIKKFNVLLGGRVDHNNVMKKLVFNPRINVLYKITPLLQFRLGYAKGFRTPQIFNEDLHISQVSGKGLVIKNSKDLAPEYSDAYSSSIDYQIYTNNWSFQFTLEGFYTQLKNAFVLEQLSNNGTIITQERRNGEGGSLVTGVSFNPKINYNEKISLQAGLTYQISKYQKAVQWSKDVINTDKSFFRMPNLYGYYIFTWSASKHFSINLSGNYTGSMLAQHFKGYIKSDKLEKTADFFENNIKIDYNFNLPKAVKAKFSAGIQNITNTLQSDFDKGENRDSAYIYGPMRPRTFFIAFNLNI